MTCASGSTTITRSPRRRYASTPWTSTTGSSYLLTYLLTHLLTYLLTYLLTAYCILLLTCLWTSTTGSSTYTYRQLYLHHAGRESLLDDAGTLAEGSTLTRTLTPPLTLPLTHTGTLAEGSTIRAMPEGIDPSRGTMHSGATGTSSAAATPVRAAAD